MTNKPHGSRHQPRGVEIASEPKGSVPNLPDYHVGLSLTRLIEIKELILFLNLQADRGISKPELKEIFKFKNSLGMDVSILELVNLMIARKTK